jgi:hypothetical protein
MQESPFNSVIFIDETEIEENGRHNQGLIIHFNGVYLSLDNLPIVKNEMLSILREDGIKSFHSKNLFKEKSTENYELIDSLTEIIIQNRIPWLNFGFAKSYLKDQRLEPIMKMEFPNMDFQKNNYRSWGFFLFIHSIHYFNLTNQKFDKKIRIYADKDTYLKKQTEWNHTGGILSSIERVLGTTGGKEPYLHLSDFLGFIFRRVKSKIPNFLNELEKLDKAEIDDLTKRCTSAVMKITNAGLFHYLDFLEILPRQENVGDKRYK